MIRQLDQQISNLTTQISDMQELLRQQEDDLVEMKNEMSAIQAAKQRIIDSGVIISRPEYDVIRRDLQDMEDLLDVLESQHVDSAIIAELREEIANISGNLDLLEENNDADVESLLRDIDELEKKLAECERSKPTPSPDGDFFPYPLEDIDLQDSCGELVSISDPYTVTGNLAAQGAWMTDPVVDPEKPWYLSSYSSSTNIYRFHSPDAFHDRDLYELFTLPSSLKFEGTGVVAYNGSLYFNHYNTRNMYRYDYQSTKSITTQRQLSDAGYRSTYPYLYGGYTSIDFAVDEEGLWVIYGMSSTGGILTISKLNPETLEIENTWATNVMKKSFGECFVVCGRLYCTDSYNKHDGRVVFRFDPATGTASGLDLPFDSKYLSNTALQYNPRDQKLYAYNAGHALVYDLSFQ